MISQAPIISYQAMQKASRITKYVYQFYFPLHHLTPIDIATYYPILTVVESIIYQADSVMEESQNLPTDHPRASKFQDQIAELRISLISLLRELDLYDDMIENQLISGEEFISLENKLMYANSIKKIDVIKVAELRSSDVRLLHHILFRMLKKDYDEQLLSLLWPVEVIADIEDDFNHYLEDINQKKYNTYRMFVQLYQEKAPEHIQKELNYYEDLFEQRLAAFPQSQKNVLLELYSQFRHTHRVDIPKPILEELVPQPIYQ
jgi:hypothetical protein